MREDADIARERAADELGCTSSKIGDLETGRSKPKPAELDKLLDLYGIAGDERAELVDFARTSRRRQKSNPYTSASVAGNLRRFVDLEKQSDSTIFYSPDLVPGILQTRSYAETLLRCGREGRPDEVAELLKVRLERAQALTRTHRPPLRYWCILGEAALRSNIGGPKVMGEQIAHLIRLNLSMENVVIQVLPLGSGPHAFLGRTATLHKFPPPAEDMLVIGSYGREIFHERPGEIMRAAHDLDLVKAMALSREVSTEFLQKLHQELPLE